MFFSITVYIYNIYSTVYNPFIYPCLTTECVGEFLKMYSSMCSLLLKGNNWSPRPHSLFKGSFSSSSDACNWSGWSKSFCSLSLTSSTLRIKLSRSSQSLSSVRLLSTLKNLTAILYITFFERLIIAKLAAEHCFDLSALSKVWSAIPINFHANHHFD